MGICSSGDILGFAGFCALCVALAALALAALLDLLVPPRFKRLRPVRLAGLTICAGGMGLMGLYLWLQVYAIQFNPALSRWIDEATVRLLCS